MNIDKEDKLAWRDEVVIIILMFLARIVKPELAQELKELTTSIRYGH